MKKKKVLIGTLDECQLNYVISLLIHAQKLARDLDQDETAFSIVVDIEFEEARENEDGTKTLYYKPLDSKLVIGVQ